jgi:energy-coupling factor transport system permease protein
MTTAGLQVLPGAAQGAVRAPIARANPVAKLAVAAAISVALVLTVDAVTAGVALALELCALPWCGLGPAALLRRAWLVLLGAIPAGIVTALLGVDSGRVLLGGGWVTVTEGSAAAGLAITLRVLAIGLPGVVLLATTDPTDLADALAQILRLPHRFVLSALAAMRLVGVLAQEWEALRLARRARGIGDEGLLGRARTFGGSVFALLVLAVRRAAVLSTTMESRGFGASRHRTWARESRFVLRDGVVVLGGLAIAGVATAAGAAAGTWDLVILGHA